MLNNVLKRRKEVVELSAKSTWTCYSENVRLEIFY
jgi:hypothetical protein